MSESLKARHKAIFYEDKFNAIETKRLSIYV